jgi:fibronectin type 3 domain-containing protein
LTQAEYGESKVRKTQGLVNVQGVAGIVVLLLSGIAQSANQGAATSSQVQSAAGVEGTTRSRTNKDVPASVASGSSVGVGLLAKATPVHSVRLTWGASVPATKSLRDAVIRYNIYRSNKHKVKCIAANNIASLVGPVTSYIDTQVQAGKTYYYVVTAVSASGIESGRSNEVKAPIPSP